MPLMDCGLPAVQPDGMIGEAEWAGASSHEVEGVNFRLARRGQVLCVAVKRPGASHFTDLYLAAPQGRTLNLHASMQLGERQLPRSGGWTASSPAFAWGAPEGWFANIVTRKPGADAAVPFVKQLAPYDGQEFIIDLEVLGPGPWRLRIEASSFGDGEPLAAWPTGASSIEPSGWLPLN